MVLNVINKGIHIKLNKLEFFNAAGFYCDQDLGEPNIQLKLTIIRDEVDIKEQHTNIIGNNSFVIQKDNSSKQNFKCLKIIVILSL